MPGPKPGALPLGHIPLYFETVAQYTTSELLGLLSHISCVKQWLLYLFSWEISITPQTVGSG